MDRLIELLKTNGRASAEDLAKALSCTPQEVERQIEALEAEGALLGFQAIFDSEKINDNGTVEAVIEVRITPERDGGFDRLASRIARFDEVQSCYLMSGGYDLMVLVQGPTLQSVARFIAERLSTIPGIVSTATHFRLKAYKEKGLLIAREPQSQRLPVTP